MRNFDFNRGTGESGQEYVNRLLPGQFETITALCGKYGLSYESCVKLVIEFLKPIINGRFAEIDVNGLKIKGVVIRTLSRDETLKHQRERMRKLRAKRKKAKSKNWFYAAE